MSILKLPLILYTALVLFAVTDVHAYTRPLQATPQTSLPVQHAYQFSLSDKLPISTDLASCHPPKPLKRKSYLIGVGGAAILPIIGHRHIGGWNVLRGMGYTLIEGILGIMIYRDYFESDDVHAQRKGLLFNGLLYSVHTVSIMDAYYSIRHINEQVTQQETSIAIIPEVNSLGLRIVWCF